MVGDVMQLCLFTILFLAFENTVKADYEPNGI